MTCVVSENYNNYTVIWKKANQVLTAGRERVSTDKRISVLHDESMYKHLLLLEIVNIFSTNVRIIRNYCQINGKSTKLSAIQL